MQTAKEHIDRGQQMTLDLTSWGRLGEAMADYQGNDVFVFGGIPGERVVAEVVRVRRNHVAARILEVLEPSPHRVTPPCGYFGDCTGCQWQHLDYQEQLSAKRDKVVDALARVGGFDAPNVCPVIPSERQYGYRNHARFTVGQAGGRDGARNDVKNGGPGGERGSLGGFLGFVNRETRQFVAIDECQIMHDQINLRLSQLQGNCDETTQLSIRAGTETQDFLVQPQLFHPDIPIPTGQKSYADSVGGKQFRVSSPSFFQVNIEQAAAALDAVRRCLDLQPDDVLLDAYTGVGTFAVLLAPYVKKVLAVEESSAAVADAKDNASGVENLEFILGRTEEVLYRLEEKPSALVLDPPRSGCKPEALASLIDLGIPKVAYVSCDAETLARDLKVLCQGGYRLNQVVPIDMFPQTHHVECVAALSYERPAIADNGTEIKQLVLASASPRRKELLEGLGLRFQVEPANIEEAVLEGESAQETVSRLSQEKAAAVASTLDSGLVIGADSLVVLNGQPIGKPVDEEDARRMLRSLRGTSHQVTTGITVIDAGSGRSLTANMTSDVNLRLISDEAIEASIASGTPMDKAGAYAVQDTVLRPAASWDGCYSNIVGLPMCKLLEFLEELGYGQPADRRRAAEYCRGNCPNLSLPIGDQGDAQGDVPGDAQGGLPGNVQGDVPGDVQ